MKLKAPYVLPRGQTKRWISIPRINWSHPLAQNLEFYGYDVGNGVIVDLVRGRRQNLVGTRDALGTTKFGPGIKYNLDGTQYFASDDAIRTSPTSITWACAFTQTANVGAFSRPFGRTAGNDTAPFANWDFEINGPAPNGQDAVCAVWSTGGGGHFTTNNWKGNALNIFSSMLCTTAGVNFVFYAQGAVVQSGSAGGTYTTFDTNDAICFSGASTASVDLPFAGMSHYGGYWTRQFSAQEALQLHLEPYCFLIYPQDEMWARRVGGASVTPPTPVTLSVLYNLNSVW